MQRFLMIAVILCCFGCDKGDGVRRAAVEGRVTLDGVEIKEGTIAFRRSDNTQVATSGSISAGRYSIPADRGPAVGSNRVEIRAMKKTGRKVQAPMSNPGVMTDETVEAVPSRYNGNSTLVTDIKPGVNVFDCAVTSKE